MGTFRLVLTIFALFGVIHAQIEDYSKWSYEEPDSEEYGQTAGSKGTNCTCGVTNKSGGRVVGGKETLVNEYPYMAGIAMENDGYNSFCGATIVTPHHLITAAHCTNPLSKDTQLVVFVGGHSKTKETKHTKKYKVDHWIDHESYHNRTFLNDISVLVVKEKIIFGKAVQPACLPNKNLNSVLVQNYVKVTGWGTTYFMGRSSEVLLKANLRVVPNDQCAKKYKFLNPNNTQICTYAKGKDSCQGDSGGPVTWLDPETNRYTLVGAVSYGRGCGTNFPGVNTDISFYLPWIQRQISNTANVISSGNVQTCAKVDQ